MPTNSGIFPALYLYPLNDSFVPKHIVLAGGQRVKIGRQTNAKTVPGEKNGYFDSKVLSRQHAEVWEEGGKIYIRDVKSSNGTFINGARLSQEGVESPPFVLNTDDQVEFGIDIVGEDNQTIIHHKVSARVQCILSQEDLNAAQSHAAYAQQAQHNLAHSQQGHLQQAPPGQRRPSLHGPQNHQGSLGALAPVGRVPNKNGLSFDLILNRLQSEVQRSRETSAELHSLNSAMSEIHDSLGGVSTQPIPAYPHSLPPVRHESDPNPQQLPPPPPDIPAISNLQEQLHQTQSLLSNHVEKIHSLGLESIVGEHDGIKREIGMLRDMIDQRKHEVDHEVNAPHHTRALDDDDDARSVATVVAGERYSEDELEEENDEERRRRREELGRPRTPEPSMGLDGDSDGEGDIGMRGAGLRGPRGTIRRSWENGIPRGETSHMAVDNSATQESVERLKDRFEQLALQFESALELSRELQAKQIVAQEQIASLQAKVDELEASKETPQSNTSPGQNEQSSTSSELTPSIVSNLVELTKNLEGRWDRQREEWDQERDRLRAAKEEWERRVRRVEEDLSGVREVAATASTSATHAVNSVNAHSKDLAALTIEVRDLRASEHNPEASEFAPPSPRSISSDILRKRKRTSNRPRSRSSSPSPTRASPNGHIVEEEAIHPYSPTSINSAPYAANGQPLDSKGYHNDPRRLPTTMKGLDTISRSDSNSSASLSSVSGRKPEIPIPYMSAAATLGVALLGVAAWTAANHIHA